MIIFVYVIIRTSFDYLTFALGGSAGVYGITFYCDGVASEEAIVFVNTTGS